MYGQPNGRIAAMNQPHEHLCRVRARSHASVSGGKIFVIDAVSGFGEVGNTDSPNKALSVDDFPAEKAPKMARVNCWSSARFNFRRNASARE